MPKLLEVTQLPHQDSVAKVQIRRGWVEAGFYSKWTAGFPALFKPLTEVGDTDYLGCTLLQQVHLLINRKKRTHLVQYKERRP